MKSQLAVVHDARGLGERRALWREQHICLRCSHHQVCKVVAAIDPPGMVTISACAMFDPAQTERGELS